MSEREFKHEESDEDISDSEEDEESSEEDLSESDDERMTKATDGKATGSERALVNQPFDEAVDLSESEASVASVNPNSPKKLPGGGRAVKNQPFDEALELSESVQEVQSPIKSNAQAKPISMTTKSATKENTSSTSITVGNEMKNNPFDEHLDLSDSGDSIDTNGQPSPKARQDTKGSHSTNASRQSLHIESKRETPKSTAASEARNESVRKPVEESASSSEESGSDEDDDEEEEHHSVSKATSSAIPHKTNSDASSGGGNLAAIMANASGYKESDFAHLKVSHEIRELFQYIGRFKAQEIDLETRLKCFIPEYIPAVGDMDAFLKVQRPDGQPDYLGLKILDEPSLNQSDATVLDLQLRSTSKKRHGDIVVRSIENAEKSPREIDRWIKSIADLHRTKPPPQVHYTKTMPDIESLMQVWPAEFEDLLSKTALPSADLDLSVEQYARVICALLDIPIHKNVYESLHVLFTLYLEFSSNQHFIPLM
ncbi:intraflagellar transport protein 46 homolog isoform x1 [Plasmopara halstedii]|uniref:Intraflagellar transport protein 46 homolog isoform x1 n=1 Tax=Plasmopara halstedii TaxID=4781 RepID=A0A0P1ABA4_PLAHL|nr:intraflagellar transport protein 46 homolog isoform x1 [Plasmopara halstedii]CEG37820.1 intraflagellar transport protein 46 homolog isoform x1 [Plasmopara halstedii]|eukprot:XP_024574189.1 intraflagellar transport protein 46 homolog isoform x1 [Plasmopara halstedii]